MTFSRLALIILLVSILALAPSIQLVRCETSFEMGNGKAIQNEFEGVNRSSNRLPNGDCFGASTKIPGIEGAFAVVTVDDIGGVYVAYQSHWAENSNESERHVYFAYSHDYGLSWSKSYRVNDNGSSSVLCDSPSIAIDQTNGHIFVAWKDNRTGVANVYIDKSIDRGVSFGSDVTVYNSPNDYVPPWLPYTTNIEINNEGKIFVTWIAYHSNSSTDCDIFFGYSIDGGQTFTTPITINPTADEVIFVHPWIAIESKDVLYVAYSRRSSTSANIYLAKSQNGGSSFETPVKVTDVSTRRYCGGPQAIVAPDGKIHVVWTDNRAGSGTQYLDIYYATSLDSGQSFGTNIRVNDDLVTTPPETHPHFTRGAQGTPTIVADSTSKVHIVWEDFRNYVDYTTYCRDIYYASTSNGTGFSSNLKVNCVPPNVNSVDCADPNIAIDSQDNLFIVYSDSSTGDYAHHSIYFISVPITTEQPSETSTPTFGFQLIPVVTAFLIGIFVTQKKSKSKK